MSTSQPVGHQNGVFDADAAEAFDIGAGFDGDGHAGLKRGVVFGAEARRLVNLQAEAVAGGVHEGCAEAVGGEDGGRRGPPGRR